MSMTMSSGDVIPPIAPVRDHLRHHHGDAIQDPYEWLRDTDDPAARAYLDAENDYADALTAHLQPLRDRIFHEIKSRVLETDVSVPVADGPWWYYARTVEGQQYPLHARAPIVDRAARPDLTGEVPGEQILVDGNLLAGDSEFFSLGALTVSEDHGTLAYAVDLTGDERFDVTVVDLATGAVIDDSVRDIGYGVEFDAAADYLFYTRLDDAWRPHELWRHRLGSPVHDDVLLHTESDERFWMGLGGSRDQRWVMMALGSKTTSEVWLLPADAPWRSSVASVHAARASSTTSRCPAMDSSSSTTVTSATPTWRGHRSRRRATRTGSPPRRRTRRALPRGRCLRCGSRVVIAQQRDDRTTRHPHRQR